ncbi:hypothetical protein Y032_0011g1331 [Ancylostoma ceylanicum]|uniref:BTB domain-containing protein n=1 Tax=Ancylostoma ceylanicum TaxID=53326 RepID=A0A016VG08_9BILA|nr:hypothetical protein Y032_0011g1331 [Ancylostoma ceylanicum]
MMSGVDIVHDEELSKEQAGVAAPSVQDSQSNTDEKVATDPKNSTEGCEEAVVHEEGLEKETTKEQVTDQSLQLVSDSGQYQIGWKLTVVDASRLFVDVVCYGTLNCYSQILLKFLRACEHYSEHRRDAIKEIADVTEEQNKTTQGDSQCQEARDEIESPIDFTINPVSTITIPSLPSLEGDGDHFCINHEHFLYNEGFASLDKLRRNGILCDVELSVGDHSSIAAHKVVLASVIPYFEAMFTTEMVELKKRKIIIRSIEYEILELLVNYAYCGRLHLNAKNVVKVMFAANFFQLDNVTEKCGEYLLRRLHPSNVLGIRAYCSALNCSITVEKIDRFIEKYFTLICRSEEFLQVSVDDLVCVLSINGLYVEGEEKVFEAALAWIEHAPDERKVFASRVLACVRLKALSPSFLAVTVGRHPLIRDDTKCRELVDDAKDYHLVPAERSSTPSVDVQPRICHELPCIIFAFGMNNFYLL